MEYWDFFFSFYEALLLSGSFKAALTPNYAKNTGLEYLDEHTVSVHTVTHTVGQWSMTSQCIQDIDIINRVFSTYWFLPYRRFVPWVRSAFTAFEVIVWEGSFLFVCFSWATKAMYWCYTWFYLFPVKLNFFTELAWAWHTICSTKGFDRALRSLISWRVRPVKFQTKWDLLSSTIISDSILMILFTLEVSAIA